MNTKLDTKAAMKGGRAWKPRNSCPEDVVPFGSYQHHMLAMLYSRKAMSPVDWNRYLKIINWLHTMSTKKKKTSKVGCSQALEKVDQVFLFFDAVFPSWRLKQRAGRQHGREGSGRRVGSGDQDGASDAVLGKGMCSVMVQRSISKVTRQFIISPFAFPHPKSLLPKTWSRTDFSIHSPRSTNRPKHKHS